MCEMCSKLTYFTHLFGVSIVNIEELNAAWEKFSDIGFLRFRLESVNKYLIHYEIHIAIFHEAFR